MTVFRAGCRELDLFIPPLYDLFSSSFVGEKKKIAGSIDLLRKDRSENVFFTSTLQRRRNAAKGFFKKLWGKNADSR